MHKFTPIKIETLAVDVAVDLRFNISIKCIGKIVDSEGFVPVSCKVEVGQFLNSS